MKKILPLIAVILCITAISFTNNLKTNYKAKPSLLYESLNGVQLSDTQSMRDNFTSTMSTDMHPTILNFLITKPMLTDIVTLLNKELAAETSAGAVHKTDGIRIYFAKATPSSQITLLIVSTIDSNNIVCNHHDYFAHDPNALLYSSGLTFNLNPEPINSPGTQLYHVSGIPDDPSCDFTKNPNYIHRAIAEKMVMGCHDHVLTTKAEWISLKVINGMSSEKNCDGIRIYFATHLSDDLIPENQNKDGFILTTTHKDSLGVYNDYFDCEETTYLNEFLKGPKEKNIVYSIDSAPEDNGSLCPNNCN